MAYKIKKMSQEDLIKILVLVCKNKNNRISPNMLRGTFPTLDVRNISSFLDEIKILKVPVQNFSSNRIPSLKYRHGLEDYIENLKKELKKERLHRIVEFLSTNATQTKREFDTNEIAKAFDPELDIYEVNSLCEIILAKDDAFKIETDQSCAKGILILIVTDKTHLAYQNKRYLKDIDQFDIPIHQTISARNVIAGNNFGAIIQENQSAKIETRKAKGLPPWANWLIVIFTVLGAIAAIIGVIFLYK